MWLTKLEPTFTVGQLERLANIFDNAGQVVFGIVVLSPIISGFDKVNVLVLLLGLTGTVGCWILSVWLAHEVEKI